MNAFTIKDLENLSGIKAHTIRIWEQRYSFLNPKRTETNIRYYSNQELQTLLNIALLNRYGFKISHIDRMTVAEIDERVLALSEPDAQQERLINSLLNSMVELKMDELERTLDRQVASRGIEKAILQVIFPFLERIGILWLTHHIQPAQEHLVSNIIRQKLLVGIEALPAKYGQSSALLFLPEGEHHELGLLYVYYLLKKKGVRVWYLGADTPLTELEFLVRIKHPNFLYMHLTSVVHSFDLGKFMQQLHKKLPATSVVISGPMIQSYKKKLPANISMKRSLTDVMDFLSAARSV
ncbi:MAG: MerR family transcriptional regulator [Chitinophagaceae bacterium]|nr:MerR family transcriptional regulator [Chitinophagaceae bacterium]